MNIKLIAFDLDGTLLRNDKTVSERNLAILTKAAERGIHMVPATGRLYEGMPDEIRSLPFVRYVIAVNGAQIYDAKERRILHRGELSKEETERVFAYMEDAPAICGCYQDGKGWMDGEEYKRIEEYAAGPKLLTTMRAVYRPMEHMKEKILLEGPDLQKIQYYFADIKKRDQVLADLTEAFSDLEITTSLPNNIEINSSSANKGKGLLFLCEHLHIKPEECMTFGDGTNDISLILQAGAGVAMANGAPEVRSAAKYHTGTNEQDGVAEMIEKYLESEEKRVR